MNHFWLFNMLMLAIPTLMLIQSKIWIIMWMLLEMGNMGFILNLISKNKNENLLNFFIIQSISSTIMVTFMLITPSMVLMKEENSSSIIFLMTMMMKMGLWPFHSWILTVCKNLTWLNNLFLMTWQKISPIILLMKTQKNFFLTMLISISMLLTNFLLISQSNSKILLMLSSLIHSNWMILAISLNKWISTLYLMIYSLITILMVNLLKFKNQFNFFLNKMENLSSNLYSMVMVMNISSIPPSMGFFSKMMVLLSIMKASKMSPPIKLLILSSCTSFLIYYKIIYKNSLMPKNISLMKIYQNNNLNSKTTNFNIILPLALISI